MKISITSNLKPTCKLNWISDDIQSCVKVTNIFKKSPKSHYMVYNNRKMKQSSRLNLP